MIVIGFIDFKKVTREGLEYQLYSYVNLTH